MSKTYRELKNEFERDILVDPLIAAKYNTKIDKETSINKYQRECKGMNIDVYDVLKAFDVRNPALSHLLKKALATGQRGHKNLETDLRDIIASSIRALELEGFNYND